MERWQFIRWAIAGSALVHILVAVAIFLSTDVQLYDQAAPEPIAVDVVSEEPEKTPEPTPSPSASPDLTLPNPSASPSPAPPSQQAAAQPAPPPQPAPEPQPQPTPRDAAKPQAKAAPPPQTQPQPQAQPQPPAAPASPEPQQRAQGYIPAQPDLTVKYGVMLGLPEALPPLAMSADTHDDKDAGATATSNLATDLVAALRGHLRTCSRLPASISSADNVRVKLRVIMTPDGRLAAQPDVIEVANPLKALELKQAAVTALAACQPYTMLPPDRYREWKVLELSFTPRDFTN
jgi:outer membrane biosynthesis protein TonB